MRIFLPAFLLLFLSTLTVLGQHKVVDLELPPDMTVESSKKTLSIEGKCKGIIKWFVASDLSTKYTVLESKNSITINLPASGNIHVIGIGLIDGKTTEFAHTTVKVKAEEKKLPIVEKKLSSVYIFVDMKTISQEKLNIFDSLYQNKNINFICNDLTSPLLLNTNYNEIYQNLNKNSLMIIEDGEGKIVYSQPLPKESQEIIEIIKRHS